MRRLSLSMLLVLGFCLGASANAATLNVVGGQLVGASNVNVGGFRYDVEFVEGTCIDVFDGCDSAGDFAFGDLAAVNVASQALLDQVFVDGVAGNFDTDTTSTFGCTSAVICSAQTPYAVVDADSFGVGIALNFTAEESDGIGDGTNQKTADSGVGVGEFYMYAVWTPVAVPTVPAWGLPAIAATLFAASRFALKRGRASA
jgi:hypothetical protein